MGEMFIGIKGTEVNTDYLTGLFNRRGLNDVWEQLPLDTMVHCIYIDVDNFKLVNDIYGHSKGDELLVFIGRLLRKIFEGQIVVRMGGDEFVIICDGKQSASHVEKLFPVLQDGLKSGEFGESIEAMLSFSIGVIYSQWVRDGLNRILQQCDEAMYFVKKNGKGSYIVYDQIKGHVEKQKAIKDRALLAMEREEMQILLRPVIYLQTSEVYAAEVVLHWNFPGLGVLTEVEFMPVFVQYGIVAQVDAFVFEQICLWKNQWKGTALEHLDVYMKISGLYIMQKDGIRNIRRCLEKYQVSPGEIKLCIEENDFLENKDRLHFAVESLIYIGLGVAINNFGSASSLMVLQNIPSQILKLDAKLTVAEGQSGAAPHILRNVISLGRDLHRYIVAQEIRNAGQVELLANYGAQFGTGDFYGDAVEEPEFHQKYGKRLFLTGNRFPVRYSFDGHLRDEKGEYEGEYVGKGLGYADGVVRSQQALVFPGGRVKENLVMLPKKIMHSDNYSICFWVYPEIEQAWTSAVYVTFADGFLSLIPGTGQGTFCFRIKDDRDPNEWHDIFCRQALPEQWSYVCATYDMVTGISKLYFNGLLVGSREHVPSLKVAEKVMLGGDEYQNSFQGKLAGVEFYHYVVSAEFVQKKFQEFQKDGTFLGTDGKK